MVVCETEVECLTCHETAKVRIISFGEGFVGVCPLCGKLAYNAKELPKENKE